MSQQNSQKGLSVEKPKAFINAQAPAPEVNPHAAAAAQEASEEAGDGTMSLEDYEAQGPVGPTFQSEAAATRARELLIRPEEDEPVQARISSQTALSRQVIAQQQADKQKMVKVKPLITLSRFRVGPSWFQITAGKPTIVPKHVAELLEQKNAI